MNLCLERAAEDLKAIPGRIVTTRRALEKNG
jgi:hypothetical protein